jgi:hypothetical protein
VVVFNASSFWCEQFSFDRRFHSWLIYERQFPVRGSFQWEAVWVRDGVLRRRRFECEQFPLNQ